MEETFNIIVGTAAVTVLVIILLYGLYAVLNKSEDPDMKERHRMTMNNLKVFELTDMVEVVTVTGKHIDMTKERFDNQKYIIKLDNGTVINKSAIERVRHYSTGYGMLSRKIGSYDNKTRILVKLSAGADKKIHALEVCHRNTEELRGIRDRIVADVNEDGTLDWYKTI